MNIVASKDGTRIAYDRTGTGPGLILVGGAFEQRAMESETSQLAALPLLAQHFSVVHYDRRGRGDSSDTQPFALEREIEDIAALIDLAGGSAYLFGISSGAALAFEAALALGTRVKRLALYEPPYNDDADARQAWRQYRRRLEELRSIGQKGDATATFMALIGVPTDQIEGMREYPMWPMWESVEQTLAYDAAALGEEAAVPVGRAGALTMPVLVMNGKNSYPFMHQSAAALAAAIPDGQHRTLDGQSHEVSAAAIGPLLVDFFTSS